MENILPLEECSILQIYLESQETKTYMIPVYQRNYAWEEDEITALIKDVYDSLNKEIENQELLKAIAEKNIDESKKAISAKKADIEAIKEKIGVRTEDLKAKTAELSTIVESTAAEEAKLRAQRDACAEKIDARTMSAYDRIRKSCNNHLAVVSVFNGDSCGGCFNSIPPQRLIDIASNKKMIICEYCGRILVNPDFE